MPLQPAMESNACLTSYPDDLSLYLMLAMRAPSKVRSPKWCLRPLMCPRAVIAGAAAVPGYTRDEVMLALQYVALGLPGGVASGVCLSAEYTTACNRNVDSALCAWQNVRLAPRQAVA